MATSISTSTHIPQSTANNNQSVTKPRRKLILKRKEKVKLIANTSNKITIFSLTVTTIDGTNHHLWCHLYKGAYAHYKLYDKLVEETKEDLKPAELIVYGTKHTTKRYMGAYSDNDLSYRYSSVDTKGENFDSVPTINELRHDVEKVTNKEYNYVLMNHYLNGDHNLGFHADKETDLKPDCPVSSLSFGSGRDFLIRVRQDKPSKYWIDENTKTQIHDAFLESPYLSNRCKIPTLSVLLEDGDLLVMGDGGETGMSMQSFLEHSVPKRKQVKDGRLNLTFRGIKKR